MAIVAQEVPYRTLPMRYNFCNWELHETLHSSELPHARFLHLHEKLHIDKDYLFADLNHIRETIRRTDLRGVNRQAQRILTAIAPDLIEDRVPVLAA